MGKSGAGWSGAQAPPGSSTGARNIRPRKISDWDMCFGPFHPVATYPASDGEAYSLDSEDEQKVLLATNPKGGVNFILSNNDGNSLRLSAFANGPKIEMRKANELVATLPAVVKQRLSGRCQRPVCPVTVGKGLWPWRLGADASVAAGPAGRDATAQTDATMHADILSWSKSKGVFGGLALEAGTLHEDADGNKEIYGQPEKSRAILTGSVKPTNASTAFLDKLTQVGGSERKK